MKGGKGGQGRKRAPAAKPPTSIERAWEKSRSGPKRGDPKRDWGASEREVPRKFVPVKPKTKKKEE